MVSNCALFHISSLFLFFYNLCNLFNLSQVIQNKVTYTVKQIKHQFLLLKLLSIFQETSIHNLKIPFFFNLFIVHEEEHTQDHVAAQQHETG